MKLNNYMSNLKEEILKEWDKKFMPEPIYYHEPETHRNLPCEFKEVMVNVNEIKSFLSSKLDEIEKEVMGLLPEEKAGYAPGIRKYKNEAYNSAIQTIRERITKYFL